MEKGYEKGRGYCKKILDLLEYDSFALNNLAFFEYKLGNVYEAKKQVELIKDKHSKKPSSIVDIAFILLLDNKYKESYKWYKKLENIKIEGLDFNPMQVITFLGIEYRETKQIGILFANGYISYL